jgi:hypothetical protein
VVIDLPLREPTALQTQNPADFVRVHGEPPPATFDLSSIPVFREKED